ncbi:hypothetical protein ACWET9_10150 [Streptomyces sp. NPDC004059]
MTTTPEDLIAHYGPEPITSETSPPPRPPVPRPYAAGLADLVSKAAGLSVR